MHVGWDRPSLAGHTLLGLGSKWSKNDRKPPQIVKYSIVDSAESIVVGYAIEERLDVACHGSCPLSFARERRIASLPAGVGEWRMFLLARGFASSVDAAVQKAKIEIVS
jgi:hypothetical protein